jgi:catechol 2,3-dioxygenase-like lactoylglutathione lyase family enzyme
MTIQSIDHFNITAPQPLLDRVRDFYIQILGFQEGFRPNFPISGYWLYLGQKAMIHLVEPVDGHQAVQQNGCLDHISFLCDDIDEMTNTLKNNNISFKKFTVPDINACQLVFNDPTGFKIELLFQKC